MGFLNSCWENLLHFATFSSFLDHEIGQYPLDLPEIDALSHGQLTRGVSFPPQNASQGFQCHYPTLSGWQGCNSATDRGCWLNDPSKSSALWQYNITTDYEDITPPGISREYWLEVDQAAISPDGYVKDSGLVFNNTYPGPLIEACWGDEVTVHVTNKISNNGTTIHWHGIRQLGSTQMDGVNGVTQCPIAQNDTFTYKFKIQQYGHTWYHSHYQLQYSNGLAAPLTIYGPSSSEYDEALHPIMMTDWMHDDALALFPQELNGGAPLVDSLILGGNGSFLCSDLDPKCCSQCKNACTKDAACANSSNPTGNGFSMNFVAGKIYLLRLINASTGAMFIFSIDNHTLEVVATDLVPIHPYKTDSIFIGIGQRYQVIVEAKPDIPSADGNYWIRTRVATGCGSVAQDKETTGVLRYNATDTTGTPSTTPQQFRTLCEDEPAESLRPVVPWNLGPFQNNILSNVYEAGFTTDLEHGFIRWALADEALFLNYSDPTILHTDESPSQFDGSSAIVNYNYTAQNGYVYLIITGENVTSTKQPAAVAHPIHLHGHDFVILAQENSTFPEPTEISNTTTPIPSFNLNNPARRDVAMLYAGGYLALAFRPDNPGVWLLHCHIAFHAASGLALQILEDEGAVLGAIGGGGALEATRDGCERWEDWRLVYNQTDSGI